MGYLYAVAPVTETKKICPSGESSVVTTGQRIVAYEYLPTHVVSHRVKPDHPVLSPTGLTRPLESVRKFRRMKWRSYVTVQSCPGEPQGSLETWSYGYYQPGLAAPQPTTPLQGWELGIRQKLESGATNIAESVFELRQTADLTYKGMKTLHKWWQLYRGVRRGRIKPRPSDVASAVVIPAFVINPLLQEVGDAARILSDALSEPIIRRARWATRERATSSTTVGTEFNEGTWDRRLNAVFYGKLRVSQQRLTMGTPWELAWEVTPFSWLLDYYIGVGDWLCSLDALRGYEQVVGTISNIAVYEGRTSLASSNPLEIHISPGTRKDRSYTRSALLTVPFPPRPVWKPHSTIMRLAITSSVLCALKREQCNLPMATKRVLRFRR